jgi:hypothetical protein
MAQYKKPVLNIPAENVWGAACQAQYINGSYVKLSVLSEDDTASNKLSNRQMIETFMVDTSLITEENMEQGKKVRAFFQAFTFKILQGKRLSEFNNTAMLIANRDVITSNYDVAVIASLPSSYERGVKQQSVEQRINFARGGFIGRTGQKITLDIEVLKCVYSQKYNTNYVTGINEEDQIVFFSFKKQLNIGERVTVSGKVKAHREVSTQLSHVKEL